jgi:hypothetical protein
MWHYNKLSFIIYKSGDVNNPGNYRGIAINPSLGKLFNTILNNRLDKYGNGMAN